MKLPCKDCICLPICIAKRNTQSLATLAMDCKLLDKYIYDYINGPGAGVPHYTLNDERLLIMDHYFKHKVVLK